MLIGDVHEQPMLHFRVKPFNINVRDWSGDVRHLASLRRVQVLTGPVAASRDDHACDAHQLLELNKFALGTLYAPNAVIHGHVY